MGKFSKGIFGNFSGKVGHVVGSSWRGIDYLRSLPKVKKNRQASEAQLEQQARFALMTGFLNPLRDVLAIGYKNGGSAATPYNIALSDNIKTAIKGIFPAIELDYTLVQLSRGIMPVGINPAALAVSGGIIEFTWENNAGKGRALPTDQAVALIFCPELSEFEYSVGQASRVDEALSIELPPEFAGKDVETYIFWVSVNGKEITPTFYTGRKTVLN